MKLGALLDRLLPWRARAAAAPPARALAPAPIPSRPDLVFTPFLANGDIAVSLADPSRPDQPLVHVNEAFLALTGYPRDEVIGRNCRFLQGRLTRRAEVRAIREGIDAERYVFTRLLNHRRDGTVFDNILQVGQLRDTRGEVRYLYGFQWDVTDTLARLDPAAGTDRRDRTLSPRMRSLERLAGHVARRSEVLGGGAAGVPLVERLVALSRPYQLLPPPAVADRAALERLVGLLVAPWRDAAGGALAIEGAEGRWADEIIGPLALWLHELASASRRAGALSGRGGRAALTWGFPTERGRPRVAFRWDETGPDGDPGGRRHDPFAAFVDRGGNGARIMKETVELAGARALVRTLDGAVDATLVLANDPPAPGRFGGR